MEAIVIACTISVSDAIARGANRAGRYDHQLTEQEVKILRTAGALDLARPFLITADAGAARRLQVKAPTFEAILNALELERETDSTVRRRRVQEEEFLAHWGSPADLARYQAKTMPESEFLVILRDHLFRMFTSWKTYDSASRLGPRAIKKHVSGCDEATHEYGDQDIRYATSDGAELRADQHDIYTAIRRRAEIEGGKSYGDGREHLVELRTHVAECANCGATARLPTALVTISWAGGLRTLSREYLLTL